MTTALVSGLPMVPLLVGNILLARKNRWGWVLTGLGDVSFVTYGILTGQLGFLLDLWFLVIRLDGWRRWKQA